MSCAGHSTEPHGDPLASSAEPPVSLAVIGMSAGSLAPLSVIVRGLPQRISGALVVALHTAEPTLLHGIIATWTSHEVVLARSGLGLRENVIYVCPAQKHLIVNADATLTVSGKERVQYVRPCLDWLLDSAAAVYRERATAVLLSGSNDDGSRGAVCIAKQGGLVIVQEPETCKYADMPRHALRLGSSVLSLRPEAIAPVLSAHMARLKRLQPDAWADPFGPDPSALAS